VESFFEDIETKQIGHTGGLLIADYQKGTLLSKIGKMGSRKLAFLNATEREMVNLYSNDIHQAFWKKYLNQDVPYQIVKNDEGVSYTVSTKRLRNLPWTLVSYQQTVELKQNNQFGITAYLMLSAFILVLLILNGIGLASNADFTPSAFISNDEKSHRTSWRNFANVNQWRD
jgi:hypothetical protein